MSNKTLFDLIKLIYKEKFATITWQLIVLSFIVLILPGVPLAYQFNKSLFFEASVGKIILLTMGFCFIVFFFNFIYLDFSIRKYSKYVELLDDKKKEKILISKSTLAMGMSIAPIYFPLIVAYLNNFGIRIYSILVVLTNVLIVLSLIISNNNERHDNSDETRTEDT